MQVCPTKEMTDVPAEPLTDELLQQLLASASPEAYLTHAELPDRTFADYVQALLAEKGISRAKVIKGAGINVTYGYQIMSGERHPSRDYVIQLALGLGCDLRETQRLLRLAGKSELWVKVPRDAIIAYCIEHGMTRVECDDELYRLGEETLLDAEE